MNQRISGIDDGLCRTIVTLQFKETRRGIDALEIEDIADVCSTEGIDTLRVISYHTDIILRLRQFLNQQELDIVGILILIHQDILELLPVQGYVLCAASIFPGLMVFVAYCVWHEAYFSLKDKEKSLLVFFGFIGVINLIITIMAILDGSMMANGKISFNALNLVCAVMFIELFVVVLLKKISTSKETDEEDED